MATQKGQSKQAPPRLVAPEVAPNARTEFIGYLYYEINNLREEINSPGWTKWAVVGGIATLIWLLLSEFSSGYNLTDVLGLILVLSLFGELCTVTPGMLGTVFTNHKPTNRFEDPSIVSGSFRAISLKFLFNVFLLYITIGIVSELIGMAVTVITSLYLIFILFILLSVFIIYFANMPIPKKSKKPRNLFAIVMPLIPVALLLSSVSLLAVYYWGIRSTVNVSDFTIALISIALFRLLILFVKVNRGYLIIEQLINIRRELAFNRIDLHTAIAQTDVAIIGLHSKSVVESDLNKVLSLYREATSTLNKASQLLDAVSNVYRSKKSPSAQSNIVHPLLDSARAAIDEAINISNLKIPKAQTRLKVKLSVMRSLSEVSGTESSLENALKRAEADLEKQRVLVKRKTAALVRKTKPK